MERNISSSIFDIKINTIKEHFKDLTKSGCCRVSTALTQNIGKNASGVYVFSEFQNDVECYLYVGQSNNIHNRLKEHCAIRNETKSNFAFKLTIELSGLRPIPGTPNSTNQSMFTIPEFYKCFQYSIERIKNMNYRFICVDDKLEKNLLEIYTSLLLDSKYNDFD